MLRRATVRSKAAPNSGADRWSDRGIPPAFLFFSGHRTPELQRSGTPICSRIWSARLMSSGCTSVSPQSQGLSGRSQANSRGCQYFAVQVTAFFSAWFGQVCRAFLLRLSLLVVPQRYKGTVFFPQLASRCRSLPDQVQDLLHGFSDVRETHYQDPLTKLVTSQSIAESNGFSTPPSIPNSQFSPPVRRVIAEAKAPSLFMPRLSRNGSFAEKALSAKRSPPNLVNLACCLAKGPPVFF